MSQIFEDRITKTADKLDAIELAELTACVALHVGNGRPRSCRLVTIQRKMGKPILEFEPTDSESDAPLPRYVGKVYQHDRGRSNFDALHCLWQGGFRPPSPFTVVRPIAYIPEHRLVLQEKAPGRLVSPEILYGGGAAAARTMEAVAAWLVSLHGTRIDAPSRVEEVRRAVLRDGSELASALPAEKARIDRLVQRASDELMAPRLEPLVPSHGDFHPANVFIDRSGRVTAIDMDKFGGQEAAADVAYFLGQTAIMGRFHLGTFAATARPRRAFLRAYSQAAPSLPRERLALYLGLVFLQSLRYELCTLRTGNADVAEPWLLNAEGCLLHENLDLRDDHRLD